MPMVQFSFPQEGINKAKGMPAPKNVGSIDAWVRGARKVIPEIPPCLALADEWYYRTETAIVSDRSIILELRNRRTKERAALVFDRKFINLI